jgi:hypothetical protein
MRQLMRQKKPAQRRERWWEERHPRCAGFFLQHPLPLQSIPQTELGSVYGRRERPDHAAMELR